MAVNFRGYLFDDSGNAIQGATVQLLEQDGTEEASTTTSAAGLWAFDNAAEDNYDVKITRGSSIRYIQWNDQISIKEIDVRNSTGNTTPAATFTNTTNNAANTIAAFRSLRGTGVNDDEMYIRYYMDDASSNTTEVARMTIKLTDANATSEDSEINWGVAVNGSIVDVLKISNTDGGVTNMTLDVAGDLSLDADGGDIFFKDAGTTFGSATNSSGNLILKSGTTAAATFSGANVTFAGTVDATTDFTIGTTVITDDSIVMTPSTSDTVTIAGATNGALNITTVDNDAAAANIRITADGTVDIDSAGVLTLDSGAAINIEPASGSAILLDGTISIDAGVVTGATSITSTAFVGDITGDVTGNASGLSATLTVASGGTGATSLTDKAVLISQDTGTDTVGSVALTTSGQLIIGGSSGPAAATLTAGSNITITNGDGSITVASASAGTPTAITVADTTDTSSYVALFESATGDLAPKTDAGITYNAGTGVLTATGFAGPLTGNVTGNASGTAATVTGGTQASITATANLVTVGTIGTGVWQGTAIASTYIAADAITGAKIADDAIDSEHYADGSIDNAHIADDAIDSEHYADGSIDNAHIADDAIDSEHYADGSIDTAHIADNQITLAKMAGGADGSLITYSGSQDPELVTPGTTGQVLTSRGNASTPTFQDAGGGGAWALIHAEAFDDADDDLPDDGTLKYIQFGSGGGIHFDHSTYDNYVFMIENAVSDVDDTHLVAQVAKTDGSGGLTWDTGNNYHQATNANGYAVVALGTGSSANEQFYGDFWLYAPGNSTYTHMRSQGVHKDFNGNVYFAGGSNHGAGQTAVVHEDAAAVIAIRFYFANASAVWEAGNIRMYGIKKS